MQKIIGIFRRNWISVLGIALGVLVGYLYWFYVGCLDGTCPINASPMLNILRGGILGGLLFSFFNSLLLQRKE